MLEPIYLSEGAIPMDEFLGKWVKAEGVLVDLTTDDFNVGDFEFLDLKGHSLGMIGVRKGRFVLQAIVFSQRKSLINILCRISMILISSSFTLKNLKIWIVI